MHSQPGRWGLGLLTWPLLDCCTDSIWLVCRTVLSHCFNDSYMLSTNIWLLLNGYISKDMRQCDVSSNEIGKSETCKTNSTSSTRGTGLQSMASSMKGYLKSACSWGVLAPNDILHASSQHIHHKQQKLAHIFLVAPCQSIPHTNWSHVVTRLDGQAWLHACKLLHRTWVSNVSLSNQFNLNVLMV